MSCHGAPGATLPLPPAAGTRTVTVALVGNPNVGKSTLFNGLTGARQSVMNAPGTTVELQTGTWRALTRRGERRVTLVDLPGTYSLTAGSPDEQVAADAVAGTGPLPVPDVALVLLDATALARSLLLLAQVLERTRRTGTTVVGAVAMLDVAATRAVHLDLAALGRATGVPVVGVDPRAATGLRELGDVVGHALDDATPRATAQDHAPSGTDGIDADVARFTWVEGVLAAAQPTAPPATPVRTVSDRVDRVLLHPVAGVVAFLAVMWAVFQVTTVLATPLVDAVGDVFSGPVADWFAAWLPGPAWVTGLVDDGIVAGVGTVLSFVPLLALIFVAIGFLEDSGYLARAAFVADRALRRIGLDGRAMVPLVIGFGCNVPAVAATRSIPDARRRLLTGLLVPYTSCPARLTVYVLVAGVFFPGHAGTVIFGLYLLSGLLVVLGGLALRATLFRDLGRGRALAIALPAYHRPSLRVLGLSAGTRVLAFVRGAGGIIAGTLVVVWLLSAVPVTGSHPMGDVPVRDSAYGRVTDAVAPVLAPAGLGDRHLAAALTTGFVAKEVVVGALAQSYAVGEPGAAGSGSSTTVPDDAAPAALGAQLRATLDASSGGHATAAALAFLVLVLAYTPCLATVAEQRRAFGTRWTLGAVGAQLAVAWLLAVAVFQIGRLVA